MSQFAGTIRFHLVGTSCSPAPCSQQGGGGALPPNPLSSGKQPRIPPAPGRCPPAPCCSPTPAGAGSASAPFLIYSTPLEHARDPNGAPGTAACAGLRSEQGLQGRHGELRAGTQSSAAGRRRQSQGDKPSQGDPRAHSYAGCQGGKARPQPRPWLQGKAWRAEPGSNARKTRKKSWKTQENKVSGGG